MGGLVVGGSGERVARVIAAGAVASALLLGPGAVGHLDAAAAQDDPTTTLDTTPATTQAPPTTVATTTPPTTPAPTSTAAPETTPPPVTTAPPSGGGGGKTPVTTAKPRSSTTVRPATTPAPETTESTAPPETPPPPEATTTLPPTTASTNPPVTTAGTVTTAPAVVAVDAVPAESVSGAGRVMSFMIIGALGSLAAVIVVASRKRIVPVDPAQMPIPPLGVPITDQPRLSSRAADGASGTSSPSGALAKGVGTSSTFTPFTRITSATGVVSGEVPVSGVAGAKAVHAAGAMHELYEPVDEPEASGPITAEVVIPDARRPEVTSRFGTDGAPPRAADAEAPTADATQPAGSQRWAVPKDQVDEPATATAAVPEPEPAPEPAVGTAAPDERAAGNGGPADTAELEGTPPSVLDLVSEARRSGRTPS